LTEIGEGIRVTENSRSSRRRLALDPQRVTDQSPGQSEALAKRRPGYASPSMFRTLKAFQSRRPTSALNYAEPRTPVRGLAGARQLTRTAGARDTTKLPEWLDDSRLVD
jgi:hypothetical protein